MTAPATGLRLLAVLAWSMQLLPVWAALLSWACSSAFDGAHGVWVVCGSGCALHCLPGLFSHFHWQGQCAAIVWPACNIAHHRVCRPDEACPQHAAFLRRLRGSCTVADSRACAASLWVMKPPSESVFFDCVRGGCCVCVVACTQRVMWLPRWMRKGVFGNFAFFFVCIWTLFYRLKVIELPRPSYQVCCVPPLIPHLHVCVTCVCMCGADSGRSGTWPSWSASTCGRSTLCGGHSTPTHKQCCAMGLTASTTSSSRSGAQSLRGVCWQPPCFANCSPWYGTANTSANCCQRLTATA